MALPQSKAQIEAVWALMSKITPEEVMRTLYQSSLFGCMFSRHYYLRQPRTDDMVQMCDDLRIEPGYVVEPISHRDIYRIR